MHKRSLYIRYLIIAVIDLLVVLLLKALKIKELNFLLINDYVYMFISLLNVVYNLFSIKKNYLII